MTRSHRWSRASRATGAFTLVEIVLVVAILATLGGLVMMSVDDVDRQATSNVTLHELSEVRKAILQFKADTGFLPKRGPFNRSSQTADNGAVTVPPGSEDWFDSPANLTQLFERPQIRPDHSLHDLMTWDPGRRRGWRGPYLVRGVEGYVSIAAGLHPSGTNWTPGSFVTFQAVADPYLHEDDSVLGLSWTTTVGGPPLKRHGRPILVFDLDPGSVGPADDHLVGTDIVQLARIVSSGPDGRYDFGAVNSDDIVMHLLR
jgi:type II secretory pathway pseudopilin PulG